MGNFLAKLLNHIGDFTMKDIGKFLIYIFIAFGVCATVYGVYTYKTQTEVLHKQAIEALKTEISGLKANNTTYKLAIDGLNTEIARQKKLAADTETRLVELEKFRTGREKQLQTTISRLENLYTKRQQPGGKIEVWSKKGGVTVSPIRIISSDGAELPPLPTDVDGGKQK